MYSLKDLFILNKRIFFKGLLYSFFILVSLLFVIFLFERHSYIAYGDIQKFPLFFSIIISLTISIIFFFLYTSKTYVYYLFSSNEEKLTTIFEASPDYIGMADLDGNTLYVNTAGKKLLGYKEDENLSGKPIKEFATKETMEKINNVAIPKAIQTGSWLGDTVFLTKDNKEIPVSQVVVVKNPKDKKRGFIATVARDMTSVKNRMNQLEKTKEAMLNLLEDLDEEKDLMEKEKSKIESILSSMGDAVFATDDSGNVILMNNIAEELTGYSFNEAKNKDYRDIFNFIYESKPNKKYPDFVEKVIKTGKSKKMENHTLLITKDQKRIPVADSASPIKNKSGYISGCVVVFRDVSKERELAEDKSNFLSIAAHQLRTPLGSMRWIIEMLQDEKDIKKIKEQLDVLYDNNKRLIYLVNSLLDVTRIDQRRVKNDTEKVKITDVVKDVLTELDLELKNKKIKVIKDYDNNISSILVDRSRLFDVVQNLISNAIKYNKKEGKINISIKDKQSNLIFQITDTGIGIPNMSKEKLFNKFYRAENARHSNTEGSGLGLFVVKSYIENRGGTVSFSSIEGKGSTFKIILPKKIRKGKLNTNLKDESHKVKSSKL